MAPVNKHPTFAVRPRRRSSSAQDAIAADLAARRPRRLSVGSRRPPPSALERALERPQLLVGAICAVVFILGTLLATQFETSLSTSALHHVHGTVPARTAYFARKNNAINTLFVKRAWGWTAGLYLVHLWTSPPRPSAASTAAAAGRVNPALHAGTVSARRSRAQRFAALVLATLAWVLFTAWCFGAGLGDRIIQASGGTCSVPLPPGLVDVGALEPLLPEGHTAPIVHTPTHDPHVPGSAAREALYMPLPHSFCARHVPLTPHTHPRLYDVLHAAHEDLHRALHLPHPRWSGGFDISGHAFLLTMGAVLLAAELAPSWRAALARYRGSRTAPAQLRGIRGLIHTVSTALGTVLVVLWVWMLLMTAVYFHDPHEKLAGLALGLLAPAVVNYVTPGASTPVIEYKVRGPTRRPAPSFSDDVPPHSPVFTKSQVEIPSAPPSVEKPQPRRRTAGNGSVDTLPDSPLSPLSPTPVARRDTLTLLEEEAAKRGVSPKAVAEMPAASHNSTQAHLHQE